MTASTETRPATAPAYPLRRFARRPRPARQPRAGSALVLSLILVCQLMVVLDATIVNIALPDIRADLGFSAAGLSWVVNAYTLTFGGLLLLGARAGDILGRRRVFLAGIALFTAASLAGGFAQSAGELLAARAVQGVGGALASPTALALLMTMFTGSRERTRAIGLYTAVSIGGAAIGLVAGGMLSEWASWRWVLFVNVPIGIVLLVAALPSLPDTPGLRGRFDVAGALTSTLGMAALVYGFVHAASDGWSDPMTLAAFGSGIALLLGFVVTEARVESPITPLRLFADRVRATAYVARLLLVAGMMGMFFFLTQFLHTVLGYSDLRTGFAFLPMPIAVFAASQLSARVLVERVGGRRLMLVGLVLSTIGMIWLTQLSADSGYGALLGPLAVFATGNGLAFVPLTSAALEGVAPQDSGAASGLVNVMQQVGGSLGLAVLVTVFGAASTDEQGELPAGLSPHEAATRVFVHGADTAFWMAAVFLAGTLALVAFAMRPKAQARHAG
ncbi:drug resistance transporter, EmrB/QacA subfamily [Jatrophihabitans endophyticus]|uniref:Drug resistance transporter, EmrB/QacA subfamily n=1 Tax=Jatrophihabitans endophyticus TaxID=1206085 RepID=A0A1M5CBE9_9ACTN|nr:MFS transporter [Jatrophihabitans endophyticus]SHF51917.1 drug resistance transporter, EmrB/QacA subfamily [Jatrophihabitans endophyticus]